jgi:Fe-coproporphyrin III synthase
MKCQMCDIWKHPSDIKTEIKARDLETLPQMKFVNITGGEPFVRNDLGEIIEVAFTKAPRVVISTAGYHVDEILALADRFPNIGIRVSIEGLSTINDMMRGRDGGFDRGMRTLLGLRQMGVKDIGIATTVSQNNCHELIPIYELTKNMDMDFATAAFHNSFYFHKEDNTIDQPEQVSDALFDLADLLLKENRPKDWFRAFFNVGLVNYVQGQKRLLPCEAGSVNFFIEPNGDVYPCNGLEERFWKKTMGNIKQETFEEIWFGNDAEKVRELVKTCPKNCWMVGTAAPVMKKYIAHPLKWVMKHKLKSLVGKKIDRDCLPGHFDVGQSPEQGDLRGGKQFPAYPDDPFPMSSTRRFITKVIQVTPLTQDSFLLRLQKGDFEFIPGQNVSIGPHLEYYKNRDYTFCSSPSDPFLEFMVKKVNNGEISPWLAALSTGDIVELVGPYGDFGLNREAAGSHLFIATGVGIGPFKSVISSYHDIDFILVHGIRTMKDLCLADGIPSERYISCITQEDGGSFRGRVTGFLESYAIPDNAHCYLCGNPYMLKHVKRILLEKGVPKTAISVEPYYTY